MTCKNPELTTKAEIMDHLAVVHGLTRPFKGSRTMDLHLDMEDRYTSSYSWTISGVKLAQQIVGPRHS